MRHFFTDSSFKKSVENTGDITDEIKVIYEKTSTKKPKFTLRLTNESLESMSIMSHEMYQGSLNEQNYTQMIMNDSFDLEQFKNHPNISRLFITGQ